MLKARLARIVSRACRCRTSRGRGIGFTLILAGLCAISLVMTISGRSSQIVFASYRSGSWQIFIMEGDGTHVKRLTYLPGDNVTPTLSANARTIAFTHYGRVVKPLGSRDIYFMHIDGTHIRRFTRPPLSGEVPGLSPDGRKVAFAGWMKGIGTAEPTIFVGNTDSSHLVNTERVGAAPSFSPDGRRIAFTCRNGVHTYICLMDPDGSHLVTLIELGSWQSAPRFSPDGRKVVYEDCKPEEGCYPYSLIYIMNVDGSNAHRIESTASRGAGASFDPDGRIVFTKLHLVHAPNDWADGQICVMDQDGTQERCLTHGPAQNVYSPFGVVF